MTYQSILKNYIVFLCVLLGVSLFYIHGERPKMKDAKESKSLGKVENLIDAWVEMWNSYDFLQKGKKVFALPICILPITNRWNPGGLNFDEIRGQASSPKMPSITLD